MLKNRLCKKIPDLRIFTFFERVEMRYRKGLESVHDYNGCVEVAKTTV